MRVFVSSTVYDLIDVRAELNNLLVELSVSPVLSDHKLSEFNLAFDANSIETCLLNVETSDAVIVILDQRYGPRLGKYGFDDVSATHLEYRHAKKHQKPIYFYVRDRLEADFNIYRKNQHTTDVALSWVQPKDLGLLEFLEEHRELRAASHNNNWFSLFTDSHDLKQSVRRHFEPIIKPQVLLEAIQQNRFPLFARDVSADRITMGSVPSIKCRISLKNVGLAPAFNFKMQWQLEGREAEITDLVAPGDSVDATIMSNLSFGPELDANLLVEYGSAIGVTVREQYKVYCLIQGGLAPAMLSGATLVERTYHNAPTPSFVIQGETPVSENAL